MSSSGIEPNSPDAPIPVVQRGQAIRTAVLAARREWKHVGLVPTMGALHAGHLSLVAASAHECDVTVVTLFVNPAQFDDANDLADYPRDLDADRALLAGSGCDFIFSPSASEIYPVGHESSVDVGSIAQPFEGTYRPGHFRGVATIVLKLFNLVPANHAYFGQKDYQQTLVIRRLIQDFNLPIEIYVCPTVREPDGLAMSSRNARLTADDRRRAAAIPNALFLAEELASSGERDADTIRKKMRACIESSGGVDIEYLDLVAEGTVTPVRRIDGAVMAIVAARLGETRLIDNHKIS